MSHYDYVASKQVRDTPFYALIMAAMMRADTVNSAKLRTVFPEVWDECEARYNAPGGILPTDNREASQ